MPFSRHAGSNVTRWARFGVMTGEMFVVDGQRPFDCSPPHLGLPPCLSPEGFSSPVGQHVDPLVVDGVDRDGAVPVPTAQREVVHTQHARRRPLLRRNEQQGPRSSPFPSRGACRGLVRLSEHP